MSPTLTERNPSERPVTTEMQRAEQMFDAIGAANRAWEAVLAADARYQFLLSTAKANRADVANAEEAAVHFSTGAPWRRERAMTLAQLRKAFLYNGYRGIGAKLRHLRNCRREEKAAAIDAQFLAAVASLAPAALQQSEAA
jgi:hypothetical protein